MNVKKLFNVLVIFMMFVLTLAPSSEAWGWKTHSDIVDAIYYGLPPEVQKNLNLQTMRDASNDPDEVFKDFNSHSYPNSYTKAKSWLDKGKAAYERGDYNEASYDYGVASHYISDTFSAPHCVSKEKESDHTKYEDQAKSLKPTATYISGDLNTMMKDGYTQGAASWNEWLQTKNTAIVQNNLNAGASAALSAIKDSINVQSTSQPTETNNNNKENQNTVNTTPNKTNNNTPWTTYLPASLAVLVVIGIISYLILNR